MENGQLTWITNFIWGIADDVLRDLYVRGKYRDVILPMTVIRRLDAVLEPTKQAVLDMKASLDKAGITNQDAALRQAAGQAFYNTSKFTLRDLKARASRQQLEADFRSYLDGFSPNVQEIIDNFEFRNQISRLAKADALGALIEKFLDPSINLSPYPVLNSDGTVRLPGLDNHAMGTIFEELVRRFNEENNEEAGEHWTPRIVKVIRLESYEDALNNLTFDETGGQQALKLFGEEYLLSYMLKWETRKSATLLNVEKLQSPFSYQLHIHRDGETRARSVDLPETFAYLLGLDVQTRKVYDDGGRRYVVYRGALRNGRTVAVLWRETKGWTAEDYRRDAAFVAEQKLAEGSDEIFVNGDSLIPGARSLDPIFKERMFAGVEA